MNHSWLLVAARQTRTGDEGLWNDAVSLANQNNRVELLVLGDSVYELLKFSFKRQQEFVEAGVQLLVDAHSLRRRGNPPLHASCVPVDDNWIAERLLHPEWRVVWR